MGVSESWNSSTPIAESKEGHGEKDELSTQFNRSISIVRDYTNRRVKIVDSNTLNHIARFPGSNMIMPGRL